MYLKNAKDLMQRLEFPTNAQEELLSKLDTLLNLYDFADDEEISSKAKQLLDVMMFSVALHSFDGYPCSSEGRTYAKNLLKIEKNEMDSYIRCTY